MRWVIGATLAFSLAGCGALEHSSAGASALTSPTQARACLTKAGFRARGGPPPPGDTNAPDYELVIDGRGPGAFIAFYKQLARAKRYEPAIRKNAKRFGGAVEARGTTTIVWTKPPPEATRARVRGCLF